MHIIPMSFSIIAIARIICTLARIFISFSALSHIFSLLVIKYCLLVDVSTSAGVIISLQGVAAPESSERSLTMINVSYTGLCPELITKRTIRIDYQEVVENKKYKKVGYFCSFSDSCSSLDAYGLCPLLQEAPSNP